MATVGRINVVLAAKTGAFTKAMNTSSKSVSRLGKATSSLISKVTGLGLAFSAGAMATGFALFIKSSAAAIDNLAKTSDKLGITTEDLAKLRYAAKVSGVEVKTFDMALQRMTRRLAEAATGTGEAKAAIKELGLDAARLSQAGPAEAFRQITRAMGSVESQADKVRLAFKLFDSEGVALVNTLALGADGLERLAKEAESAGLTLSRVDAGKVEELNNAVTKLKAEIAGLGQEATVAAAGPLRAFVEGSLTELLGALKDIGSWAAAHSGIWQSLNPQIDSAVVDAEKRLQSIMEERARTVERLGKLEEWQRQRARVGGNPFKWLDGQRFSIYELEKSLDVMREQIPALDARIEAGERLVRAIKDNNSALESNSAAAKAQAQADTDAAKAADEHAAKLEKQKAELDKLGASITRSVMTPLETMNAEIEQLNTLMQSGSINTETYTRAFDRAKETFEATLPAIDDVVESINDIDDAVSDVQGIGRELGQFEGLVNPIAASPISNDVRTTDPDRARISARHQAYQRASMGFDDSGGNNAEGWLAKIYNAITHGGVPATPV